MICLKNCGLLFNYILDLIFIPLEKEKVFIKSENNLNRFHYLKNKKPISSIPIVQSKSLLTGLDHDMLGANFHIFNYHDDIIQKMIWQMKFRDNYTVVKIFGWSLAKTIYDSQIRSFELYQDFNSDKCFLVPIPIHYRRLLERGYNQTERLCKEVVSNLLKDGDLKFDNKIQYRKNILRKNRYSKKQSRTISENRTSNIKDSFSINLKQKDLIKNATIILVDDVFTTGATIKEASKVLKKAGAKKVISFTVAR